MATNRSSLFDRDTAVFWLCAAALIVERVFS